MTLPRLVPGDYVRITGKAVEAFLGMEGVVLAEEEYPFEIAGDLPVYRVAMDDDPTKDYFWRADYLETVPFCYSCGSTVLHEGPDEGRWCCCQACFSCDLVTHGLVNHNDEDFEDAYDDYDEVLDGDTEGELDTQVEAPARTYGIAPELIARLEAAVARLEDLNNYGQEA